MAGGAIFRPVVEKPFALRFGAGYSYWQATNQLLDLGSQEENVRLDDGHGSMFSLNVEGLLEFGRKATVGGYVGAGIGGYRRYVQLTEEVIVPGYICDPWWGVCYPGATAGDLIVSDDKTTTFGYNFVLGAVFPLRSGTELYVEVAYHEQGASQPTEYIPIQFGVRW